MVHKFYQGKRMMFVVLSDNKAPVNARRYNVPPKHSKALKTALHPRTIHFNALWFFNVTLRQWLKY